MAYKNVEKRREFFRERYAKNQEAVRKIKLESGCVDCGYNEHHAGLEFDHVRPRIKGTVASQMGKSLKVILEEIAQCEVVCGTCHNIRSFQRESVIYGRGNHKGHRFESDTGYQKDCVS